MRCKCGQYLTLELSHSNTDIGDGGFPKARPSLLPTRICVEEAFGTYSLLTAFHSKATTSGVESRSQCLLGNIWHRYWENKRALHHCDLESGWGWDKQGGRYACEIASLCMGFYILPQRACSAKHRKHRGGPEIAKASLDLHCLSIAMHPVPHTPHLDDLL